MTTTTATATMLYTPARRRLSVMDVWLDYCTELRDTTLHTQNDVFVGHTLVHITA